MNIFERSAWGLYQTAMGATLLTAAPFLLARRGRHYLTTLPGRLGGSDGIDESFPRGALWIHAVSVGEVAVAATLIRALPDDLPLLITTVTPTGQERARATFPASSQRAVAYLPFDLGFATRRFLDRFEPSALVLVEGDYWPLVLREAERRHMPVAVVNGRVGETSSRRLRRIPRLARNLFFSRVKAFGVQTEEDRRRLIAGGADGDRVQVTGNLKYDTPRPETKKELERSVRALANGRPILIAGSTMAGEDEQILEAFRGLGGGSRALLVLVPRHPERWDAVARLVSDRDFRLLRRSQLESETIPADGRVEVLLLDSLGELAALYTVAQIAFIGGTLVSTGGHNPLEPAQFAVPTVVGPSMHNFREMAERFEADDAWAQVADGQALQRLWDHWLDQPEEAQAKGRRAAALLEDNRGAVHRTLELLAPLLDSVSHPSSPNASESP